MGALLLGIGFGALAMLVSAVTGSCGTAIGITSTVAAARYLISALAGSVQWVRPGRVLVVVVIVLLVATVRAFARLDVH